MLTYKNFESQRRFGVEFEVSEKFPRQKLGEIIQKFETNHTKKIVFVEGHSVHSNGASSKGWAESYGNEYWHIKYDSTCGTHGKKSGHHGWEIASYIAKGLDEINVISKLANYLKEQEVEVNKFCGYHIHAEVIDFTVEQMGVLFSRWVGLESILLQSCPSHRRSNIYCKSIRKKFFPNNQDDLNPASLWKLMRVKNFGPHENQEKKVTLNSLGYSNYIHHKDAGLLQYINQRPTIELRLPECLLDETHVKNWILLYLNFVDQAKDKEFLPYEKISKTQNLLDVSLNLLGLEDKNCILSQELYDVKVWFLQRIIQNTSWPRLAKKAQEKLEYITHI